MCRNIRTLHNFDPPATNDEVHAAALQYVRKVSGTTKPSAANQAAFDHAVHEIAHITRHLLEDLVTNAPAEGPGDRGRQGAGEGCHPVRDRGRQLTRRLDSGTNRCRRGQLVGITGTLYGVTTWIWDGTDPIGPSMAPCACMMIWQARRMSLPRS